MPRLFRLVESRLTGVWRIGRRAEAKAMSQLRGENLQSPDSGWAPWGSKQGMRVMAVFGFICSVFVLALGMVLLSSGHRGGLLATVVGGALLACWLFMLPFARRRGKI